MAYAYFLGCIMNNRYPGIEKSTRVLMDKLGVELEEMEGASCCPAPGVFGSFDKETWATIAARNLTIAEDMGDQVLTECNGCFGSLHEANLLLQEDEEFKDKVNGSLSEINREFKGTTEVRHFAEVLYNEVGLDKISEIFEKKLNLNVAVHYGCHFLKPSDELGIDNPKNPKILDELVEITGAKSVPYTDKMMCCGAGGGLRARDKDVTTSFTHEKLQNMTAAGVDAIVDVCPFCHMQFDVGQKEVNEKYGTDYELPVLHLAQLYGLAMGLSPEECTLDKQIVDPTDLVNKMNTAPAAEPEAAPAAEPEAAPAAEPEAAPADEPAAEEAAPADSGKTVYVIEDNCVGCGLCANACPMSCIAEGTPYVIDANVCVGCGLCADACPVQAIHKA